MLYLQNRMLAMEGFLIIVIKLKKASLEFCNLMPHINPRKGGRKC